MKFLVIGLGSMGKRRVRCLQSLGHSQIVGFDPREDRCAEAQKLYGITTTSKVAEMNPGSFDAFVISTPPDLHLPYLKLALEHKKPAFVEASVILEGLGAIEKESQEKGVFIAPSATLFFHPVIKDIHNIVKSRKYGKVTNFSYMSGQYLPDWHPWEPISDYYVSKKETGGAREIVPFELTWMSEVFGWPTNVRCVLGKTMNLGVDIDDTYALSLQYEGFIGQLMVDVVARFAQRNLIINLERAQITWNWNDGLFKLYEAENNRTITFEQPSSSSASGYNKNIIEQMYIDEVQHFISGISQPSLYPNSLANDIKVLKILNGAEANARAEGTKL